MKMLGLPGRDEATVAWLASILDGLELGQDEAEVQRYDCWDTGGDFDLSVEIEKAAAAGADVVVAKSMGTRVAIHAANQGALSASEYVLIGIPLAAYGEEEVALLNALCEERRVLIIQQTDDFLGGFAEVDALVTGANAALEEVPGSDHVYSDVEALIRLIAAWYPR